MKKKVTVQKYFYASATEKASEPFSTHSFEINRPHRFAGWRDAAGLPLNGLGIPFKDGEHVDQSSDIVTIYTVETI